MAEDVATEIMYWLRSDGAAGMTRFQMADYIDAHWRFTAAPTTPEPATIPVTDLVDPRGGFLCGPVGHGIDKDPMAKEWSGKVTKPKAT
jgi:hypothetical protein